MSYGTRVCEGMANGYALCIVYRPCSTRYAMFFRFNFWIELKSQTPQGNADAQDIKCDDSLDRKC